MEGGLYRRASVGAPSSDAHRTPCTSNMVHTPRKTSRVLGKGGIYYGSSEAVSATYLSVGEPSAPGFRVGQGLRGPSVPRETSIDLSCVYKHPEPRRRRCMSEDRDMVCGVTGWRGTGGRSTHASKTNLAEDHVFKFLPPSAVNLSEPPVLLIKKRATSVEPDEDLSDSGVEMDMDGNEKRKKVVTTEEDRINRLKEAEDLEERLQRLDLSSVEVEEIAEKLLKRQNESEEFQIQTRRETEGYDLQRGVQRQLEAVAGDRRELVRLHRKVADMIKRQLKGAEYPGEDEELRALIQGTAELEKKVVREKEELARLSMKTEQLIERQRKEEELRLLKLKSAACKNDILRELMMDSCCLEKMLSDLRQIKCDHSKADKIRKQIQELNDDYDEMGTDEIILDRIMIETESATDFLLKSGDDIRRVQDAIVEKNAELNIEQVTKTLRQCLNKAEVDVQTLKAEMKSFLAAQEKAYADILKQKKLKTLPEPKKEVEEKTLKPNFEIKKRPPPKPVEEVKPEPVYVQKPVPVQAAANEVEFETCEEVDLLADINLAKQKEEILTLLSSDYDEIERMKYEIVVLVDKHQNIEQIQRKRRKLYTIPEEDEQEEVELLTLRNRTSTLASAINDNERELIRLKSFVDLRNPAELLREVEMFEDDLTLSSYQLRQVQQLTEECYKRSNDLLEKGLKSLLEQQNLEKEVEEDTEKVVELMKEVQKVEERQEVLKASMEELKPDDSEINNRLGQLAMQETKLVELKRDIEVTTECLQKWKDYTFSEAAETEMNKYGMVSSLAIPSFPLSLIKDPKLLAEIASRLEEKARIRRKLQEEERRMREICEAIAEMEERQREAELRRIARQAVDWVKDPAPYGRAEFGTTPTFKSDFHVDPEEARAAAASRKASRLNSRESSVVRLEDIGAMRGYDDMDVLLGYGARSRQQSLERGARKSGEGRRQSGQETSGQSEGNGPDSEGQKGARGGASSKAVESSAHRETTRQLNSTNKPPVPRRGRPRK